MFLKNKYYTWYYSIIGKAKHQNRKKLRADCDTFVYYEKHHIIPVSLGGNNSKDNLVLLTAKEHFICHLLLCHMTVKDSKHKMINALVRMSYSKSKNQLRHVSNSYTLVRSLIAKKNSELFRNVPKSPAQRKKMSESQTGKKHDDERIRRRIEINKEMWDEGVFDNRPKHTNETKEKIKEKRANQIVTEEHKKNISLGLKGHRHSEETKTKMSKLRKASPKIWIKNPKTREYSSVTPLIAEKYLDGGWVKGKYQKEAKYIKLK